MNNHKNCMKYVHIIESCFLAKLIDKKAMSFLTVKLK